MNKPKTKRGRPPKKEPISAPMMDWGRWKHFIGARLRGFAFWLRRMARKNRTIARSVESLLVVFPPYFVTQFFQIEKFGNEMRKDWPLVASVMDHNVAVTVIAAGVWAYFILALSRFIVALTQDRPDGWSDAPGVLLSAIDNVVGAKEQRFSRHLQKLRLGGAQAAAGDVFSEITKPDEQMNSLILGVYSVFDSVLKGQIEGKYVLKVNLATVDHDGNVKSIHFHYPSNHPVRSSLEALNDPRSAMRSAVRTRQPVILESIYAESLRPKPRFVVTDSTREKEDGSLICFPVIHDALGVVVFVISIHVDRAGVFKQKYLHSYTELLKPFSLRIKLEYSLFALKEIAA